MSKQKIIINVHDNSDDVLVVNFNSKAFNVGEYAIAEKVFNKYLEDLYFKSMVRFYVQPHNLFHCVEFVRLVLNNNLDQAYKLSQKLSAIERINNDYDVTYNYLYDLQ